VTDPARRQALRNDAARCYTTRLVVDPAAQTYLASRGIAPQLGRRLGLGAADRSWTGVTNQLRSAGYTDAELIDAGVGFRSARGTVVDVFRSRVLFPAHDERGALVGWAGRSTPAAPQHATHWLNSPTGDYRKGELLHGLHEGRSRLSAGAVPVLCEGVFDAHAVTVATRGACIGLATAGTALTSLQVDALGRAVTTAHRHDKAVAPGLAGRRVLVAFDADHAGQHAAAAAWPLLQAVGATTDLVPLPHGADPAGVGADALVQALRAAHPLVDLVVDNVLAAWPDRDRWAEHKLGAARAAARTIAALRPEQVARQVARVATALRLPPDAVTGEVADAIARHSAPMSAAEDDWHEATSSPIPARAR